MIESLDSKVMMIKVVGFVTATLGLLLINTLALAKIMPLNRL